MLGIGGNHEEADEHYEKTPNCQNENRARYCTEVRPVFLLVCLVGIWGIAANYFVGHWEYVWSANLSLAIAVIGAVGALFSAFAYTD